MFYYPVYFFIQKLMICYLLYLVYRRRTQWSHYCWMGGYDKSEQSGDTRRMIKPTELQTQRFFSCMGKKDVPSALRQQTVVAFQQLMVISWTIHTTPNAGEPSLLKLIHNCSSRTTSPFYEQSSRLRHSRGRGSQSHRAVVQPMKSKIKSLSKLTKYLNTYDTTYD